MSDNESPTAMPPRSRRARAIGDIAPAIGGAAFRQFGFAQSAIVARWSEIVGDHYARYSLPEALRFPPAKRSGGTLQVVVTSAFAPLLKAVEPQVIERVNRFFGYGAVARVALRQGDMPAPARRAVAAPAAALSPEVAATLLDIADPELRTALEALAQALGSTRGPPIVR